MARCLFVLVFGKPRRRAITIGAFILFLYLRVIMCRKTILYIACSLDGYIAAPNDNLDFLSAMKQEGEDYGYNHFIDSIDAVVLGRKTYDWVMARVPEFPHANTDTYVITRVEKPPVDKIKFYTGSLKELILKLKAEQGKNIFIDGGAEIVNELLKEQLIDEFVISLVPLLLGAGTRLFNDGRPPQWLEFVSAKAFDKGLVQLQYKRLATKLK